MQSFTKLARTAASQFGLLTTHQLRALGFSDVGIHRIVEAGQLLSVRRGLFRLPGSADSPDQRLASAYLLGGPLAAVSHMAAARHWDMWSVGDELDVTIRHPKRLTIEGVRIHRSRDICRRDITHIDDMPITTPIRTLIDVGKSLPKAQVQRLTEHQLSLGHVDRRELWLARIRLGKQGRDGVGVMGEVLGEIPDGIELTESGPEVELLRLMERAGLPRPAIQHPIRLGGEMYRLDFAYPDAKVAIEYDGLEPHTDQAQFERDRQRQNALILAGWTVLRFTWADLTGQPTRVTGEIRTAIGDL